MRFILAFPAHVLGGFAKLDPAAWGLKFHILRHLAASNITTVGQLAHLWCGNAEHQCFCFNPFDAHPIRGPPRDFAVIFLTRTSIAQAHDMTPRVSLRCCWPHQDESMSIVLFQPDFLVASRVIGQRL